MRMNELKFLDMVDGPSPDSDAPPTSLDEALPKNLTQHSTPFSFQSSSSSPHVLLNVSKTSKGQRNKPVNTMGKSRRWHPQDTVMTSRQSADCSICMTRKSCKCNYHSCNPLVPPQASLSRCFKRTPPLNNCEVYLPRTNPFVPTSSLNMAHMKAESLLCNLQRPVYDAYTKQLTDPSGYQAAGNYTNDSQSAKRCDPVFHPPKLNDIECFQSLKSWDEYGEDIPTNSSQSTNLMKHSIELSEMQEISQVPRCAGNADDTMFMESFSCQHPNSFLRSISEKEKQKGNAAFNSLNWLNVNTWLSKLLHGIRGNPERRRWVREKEFEGINSDERACKLQSLMGLYSQLAEPDVSNASTAGENEPQDAQKEKKSPKCLVGEPTYIPPSPALPPTEKTVLSTPFLYKGPRPTPALHFKRLCDPSGPIAFPQQPLNGIRTTRAELRLWEVPVERIISQNGSKRKVHRANWLTPIDRNRSYPAAIKFVEDGNNRDGRSLKREIECHLYIYQQLRQIQKKTNQINKEIEWPCSELFGYYLDKHCPGNCVLVTRKLSGPDFFDIIRSEHSFGSLATSAPLYEYQKLRWCILALQRVDQYNALGIRHNDIKPDNIVLDLYVEPNREDLQLDVKIIDLGTASMESAKDFTGGTSWYESPEQKLLEFHTKKLRNPEEAKKVEIGLKSDLWGAGISMAEVLVGRRIVDHLKPPDGPGPLEYLGSDKQWAVHPTEWIKCVRKALGLNKLQYNSRCAEAASYILQELVHPSPACRTAIKDIIPAVSAYADEARKSVGTSDLNANFSKCLTEQLRAVGIQSPL